MMALFGMVWLLKVRKHLRHCAHCRAHLRTCAQCRARPSPSLPSIINSRDSTKESCAQDTASQTSPPELERGRITLDLVAHPPPRDEDSDDPDVASVESRTNGEDRDLEDRGVDVPVESEGCVDEGQFLSYDGRVSPALPAPPPPPPRSPAPLVRDGPRSPRRSHDPALSVAQQPCESAAGSLASRVCSLYGQDSTRPDPVCERRRSFSAIKRRSLPEAEELEVGDEATRTATLPRQSSTGSGYRFCYTPGHTHPYACPPLAGSTPQLPLYARTNHDTHTQEAAPTPHTHATQAAHTLHTTPHITQSLHPTLPVTHPRETLPQVTLDPRYLPGEALEGAYGGSDSSRSSHSGSRSSYSDHSLPPPLPFSEGAIHYLPTPSSTHAPTPAAVHAPTQYHQQVYPRVGRGYGRRSSIPGAPCPPGQRGVHYWDGVWSIPTSSTLTTFLGADYPTYDPTTVPGRDRRPHAHTHSPRGAQGTIPRARSSSRSRSSPGGRPGRSHSRSPSRHLARIDLLEECGGTEGGGGRRAGWQHENGGVATILPPPPRDWGAPAASRASFCALHGYNRPKDIQEFYEITLLDDSKSVQQKTAETLQIASKWEINSGPMTPHITCTKDEIELDVSDVPTLHLSPHLCLR
ncbi:uncharacterized protein LOC121878571 [Homarus americanus]|uniref:uncharacterized protein LOC121878571 n=1 Tax=Homarus americanus TaxID=6706 RepID=UPI001C492DFE|nr:uncharacterized protein LOC121878571 [Homarus americanus]